MLLSSLLFGSFRLVKLKVSPIYIIKFTFQKLFYDTLYVFLFFHVRYVSYFSSVIFGRNTFGSVIWIMYFCNLVDKIYINLYAIFFITEILISFNRLIREYFISYHFLLVLLLLLSLRLQFFPLLSLFFYQSDCRKLHYLFVNGLNFYPFNSDMSDPLSFVFLTSLYSSRSLRVPSGSVYDCMFVVSVFSSLLHSLFYIFPYDLFL